MRWKKLIEALIAPYKGYYKRVLVSTNYDTLKLLLVEPWIEFKWELVEIPKIFTCTLIYITNEGGTPLKLWTWENVI